MRLRWQSIVALLAGAGGGVMLAAAIASAGGTPQVVTLGSTAGTPSANICLAESNCTYVPFSGVANPELQVPFDGTVTSFAVNAGSAGGKVELRVRRPAGGGQFTGAGTSPPEVLGSGVSTITVSLPVQAGDVLALDNSSSALIFDTSSATAITAYYEPALADGSTSAPNQNRTGYKLLLAATVKSSGTQTTGTQTTGSTGATAPPGSSQGGAPPTLSDVKQSHPSWREGSKSLHISRTRTLPVGTTFSFVLNEPASVLFSFSHELNGRKLGHRCVAETHANARRRRCTLTRLAGTLSFAGHSATDKVSFQGRISTTKELRPGRYDLTIIAANLAKARSAPASLSFTIVK